MSFAVSVTSWIWLALLVAVAGPTVAMPRRIGIEAAALATRG